MLGRRRVVTSPIPSRLVFSVQPTYLIEDGNAVVRGGVTIAGGFHTLHRVLVPATEGASVLCPTRALRRTLQVVGGLNLVSVNTGFYLGRYTIRCGHRCAFSLLVKLVNSLPTLTVVEPLSRSRRVGRREDTIRGLSYRLFSKYPLASGPPDPSMRLRIDLVHRPPKQALAKRLQQ